MPVSPADFALWARATGNKYPETAEEKLAAAPHAYAYSKNLGKTGNYAPGPRVGGTIFYEQPENTKNTSPDSLFNSPVTPDNTVPKVSGTYGPTLTSEHFVNQESHEQEDRNNQHSLIDVIGKTALAAGTVAAGVALARNPGVQQAVRTAGTTIKENAQDIGSRVSNFLGGLGGGRYTDPDVIRNSGDVTPPTTAQRYGQDQVPVATQTMQVAKGALAGTPERALLESKPVTESEVISTSQSFSPENAPTKQQIIQSVLEKRPITGAEQEYVPNIPHPASIYGPEYERTFRYAPKELIEARRAISRGEPNPLAGAPLVDPFTGEIRNPELSVPGYKEAFLAQVPEPSVASEQTARLQPTAEPVRDFTPQNTRRISAYDVTAPLFMHEPSAQPVLGPMRHETVVRPRSSGLSRVMGPPLFLPASAMVQREVPFFEGETPYAGARDVVSDPSKKLQIQTLPGARDVEAALATQEALGVLPSGLYSSTETGEQYRPAWGAVSGIDPRVLTVGRQGYGSRTLPSELSLKSLTSRIKAAEIDPTHPDAGKVKNLKTLLKQAQSLYEITEDPNVIEAANIGALPIKVTLPGGEVAATSAFYRPFGVIGGGEGSNLTQEQLLESQLIGAKNVHSNTQKLALSQLGISTPQLKITSQQFAALPEATQKQLYATHSRVQELQSKLESAKANPYRYSIPERILEGTKMSPVINQITGDIVGMKLVPEESVLTPKQAFTMFSQSGISRHDVGGVGRRREELGAAHGIGETPEYLSTQAGGEVTPIMYQDVDTKAFVHPDTVNPLAIATGKLRAVAGQTATAQRLLGQKDRPYRGLEAVTQASFDPEMHEQLAERYPERVTPEGLIYSSESMVSPGGGSRPSMGTRFDKNRILAAPEGSARAERVARVIASEQARRAALASPSSGSYASGGMGAYEAFSPFELGRMGMSPSRELAPSQTIPLESPTPQTRTTYVELSPHQGVIPGLGTGYQEAPNKVRDVIEASRINELNAKYTGRSLQDALKASLQRAATIQPSLF